MSILEFLADNQRALSLANRFRRCRFEHFKHFVASKKKPLKILDIGGTEDFWEKMNYCSPAEVQVVLLNLFPQAVSRPNFSALVGDGRNLAQFAAKEFDLVFSNSVIEHLGTLEEQKRMADEVQRVGRSYFVQTPAKSFPLEPHFLFPFFAQLPENCRAWLLTRFTLGWYGRISSYDEALSFVRSFRLLNEKELRSLFPHGCLIHEKFCGLTKSYIVLGETK